MTGRDGMGWDVVVLRTIMLRMGGGWVWMGWDRI